MIIVGAGSAGIETLGIIQQMGVGKANLIFYDDNIKSNPWIEESCLIINQEGDLTQYIKSDGAFCVAIGQPRKRGKMFHKILSMGGTPISIVSPSAFCLSKIESNGSIIHPNVAISYGCTIGLSAMIHANSTIGHKVNIGDFVNIGPLTSVIGPVEIGEFSYIGAGCTILPHITIGKHAYIEAGSTVDRDVNDYDTIVRKT